MWVCHRCLQIGYEGKPNIKDLYLQLNSIKLLVVWLISFIYTINTVRGMFYFCGWEGEMLDRDLKMVALTLATQLPDDEMTARRVHAMLGELLDIWIFNSEAGKTVYLPSKPSGALMADTKCIGNAEELPR